MRGRTAELGLPHHHLRQDRDWRDANVPIQSFVFRRAHGYAIVDSLGTRKPDCPERASGRIVRRRAGSQGKMLRRFQGRPERLRQRYGLPQQNIIGIDHAIGYSALANGSIAVKDAYSTDAKIEQNDLFVLEDDLRFFPKYEAVFLFRSSARADAIAALRRLEGTLDETRMIRLNAEAERTKNYARAADLYFEPSARSTCRPSES